MHHIHAGKQAVQIKVSHTEIGAIGSCERMLVLGFEPGPLQEQQALYPLSHSSSPLLMFLNLNNRGIKIKINL